ncbi:MAG: glycoside hydrolase, family 3 domain protein, partial [Frankiales bacterium]|nr:glycoside hydrolase, family 3 domain protein [Frankiales bacterium]
AGLDLQMPGPDRFYGAPLARAVVDGDLEVGVLDAMVRRWLQLIERLDAWDDRPLAEQSVELDTHRAVAHRAAVAGTVLLTNDGTLPLKGSERIALIGPLAARAHIMGGGSAQLRPHRSPSLYDVMGADGVLERGCDIDKTIRPLALPGIRLELFASDDWSGPVHASSTEGDLKMLWFGSPDPGLDENAFSFRATVSMPVLESGDHTFTLVQSGRARLLIDGAVVLDGITDPPPGGQEFFGLGSQELVAQVPLVAGSTAELVVEYSSQASMILHGAKIGYQPPRVDDPIGQAVTAARAADVAIVVVGTSEEWESEGHDRASMDLPGDQDELVRQVCAANPRTVVVVCAGAPVSMPWASDAAAILLPWLGGQELAPALHDILLGQAEPGGRLPVTLPERIEHAPAFGSFGGENDVAVYSEGLLVGYRWYDSRHLPVRFPFGHGLSYTTFAWSPARLSALSFASGEQITVSVDVTNTGDRRGSDVVQVYVRPGQSRLQRPRTELRGFAKVDLDPGETGTVEVVLGDRAFAYWDSGSTEHAHLRERLGEGNVVPADQGPEPRTQKGWYVDAGPVEVVVARSVTDVVQVLALQLVD